MHTNLKKFPPLKLNTKKCKEISSEDSKNDKQKKKQVDQTFYPIPRMKCDNKDNLTKTKDKKAYISKLCFSL